MTYDYNRKEYSDFKLTYLYTSADAGFKLPVKAADNFSTRWIFPKPVADTLFIPSKGTYFRLNTDHSYVAIRSKSLNAILKMKRKQDSNRKK
jgi:hypothetical protein